MKLDELKVGDKVIVQGYRDAYSIGTIEKVLLHHFKLVGSDSKYRRLGGSKVGRDTYSVAGIEPYDETKWQQIQQQARESRIRGDLGRIDWRRCPLGFAEEVWKLLQETRKPVENKPPESDT